MTARVGLNRSTLLMAIKAAALPMTAWTAIPPAIAQDAAVKVPFRSVMEQARTTLQVDVTGLRGPGAAILSDAVSRSRYVLIGEDHLSREIPQFTVGVCRLMVRDGLDAFAVEIGPEAARVVNDDLRRSDRATRLATFMRSHPDAFAFQNGRDESDMAAKCARLAGPAFQIWGLDQEFFGSPGLLFERMLAAHPGPAARAAIEALATAERIAKAKAVASGSPGDLFLYTVGERQLGGAGSAIRRDGGERAVSLFDALIETRAIYLGQNIDGDASNRRRALLMKRTLVRYLSARPRPARVLFKFGDVHMAKGINGLRQRDVGNFVAERADGEGVGSLHIAVYGAKGVHALYGGVGRLVRHEPFVMTDDPDYSWLKDALLPAGQGRPGDWSLIDLRLLRSKMPPDMSAAWRDVVRRYDLIVVAPELTPSSLIGTE